MALLLIGAVALAAVLFALTSGSSPPKRGVLASASHGALHSRNAKKATSSTTQTSGASSVPLAASSGASPAEAGSPVAAVEAFYGAAARHDYATAWRLADANMRAEVAGYDSFAAQQSAVRSITFRRADTLPGATASQATVAVGTTSVLTNRTEQCTGTVRTVRAESTWVLDGISIGCNP